MWDVTEPAGENGMNSAGERPMRPTRRARCASSRGGRSVFDGAARVLGLLLVGLSISLCAFLVSCEGKDQGQGTITTADTPDQEFSDFTTVESDSGVVRWVLRAPVARVYNARKLLVTDNPRIEFFDRQGNLTSVLVSRKGEYNEVTHDLTALGSVVVTSVEGYVLETESLVWVDKLGEMHSEDFVKFTRGKDVLTGNGLRGDPELKNIEIERNVKAYMRDEGGMLREELRKDEAKDESAGGKRSE
jgi:LPS export ABC transporter protein LptC